MMNSGIDKSAMRQQDSFGDWAVVTEFSWSERRANNQPESAGTGQKSVSSIENKKIASRRAAAYWESRK